MSRRPCLVCGTPANGGRCPEHTLQPRGHAHAVARAQTLAEETVCWRCGQPGRPDDPLVGGHIIARAHGGPDTRANMHAEHRSCNGSHGKGGGRSIVAPRGASLTHAPQRPQNRNFRVR